jgi:hypothetical protein
MAEEARFDPIGEVRLNRGAASAFITRMVF